MRTLILEYSPSSKLKQARATVRLGTQVAKDLMKLKLEMLTDDSKGTKDIMTLLRESWFVSGVDYYEPQAQFFSFVGTK